MRAEVEKGLVSVIVSVTVTKNEAPREKGLGNGAVREAGMVGGGQIIGMIITEMAKIPGGSDTETAVKICHGIGSMKEADPALQSGMVIGATLKSHGLLIRGKTFSDFSKVFKFKFVHLGGDEVNTSCWTTTPHVKAWLNKHHMNESDGYRYFVLRAQKIAISHGYDVIKRVLENCPNRSKARIGKLLENWVKFVRSISGWTATLLFMWMPIAQMWTTYLNPDNITGLSALTILLGMIGNAVMIPRALFIRDLMWFTEFPQYKQRIFLPSNTLLILMDSMYRSVVQNNVEHELLALLGSSSSTNARCAVSNFILILCALLRKASLKDDGRCENFVDFDSGS